MLYLICLLLGVAYACLLALLLALLVLRLLLGSPSKRPPTSPPPIGPPELHSGRDTLAAAVHDDAEKC